MKNELFELAAKRMRKTVEQVLILEEKNLDSINYTLSMIDSAVNGKNEVPDHIKLHTIENDIIRELADEGPAVFIGHCAGHALKDRDDVLNVYIHGSKSFNKFRAIEKYHISPTEVDKIMKKIDRRRANFYNTTTEKKIDDINIYIEGIDIINLIKEYLNIYSSGELDDYFRMNHEIVFDTKKTVKEKVIELKDLALLKGGYDNITIVLVEV